METIAIFIIVIVLVIFITSLLKKLSNNMKAFQEAKETNKEDFKKSKETKSLNTEFKNLQPENTEDILKILKRQNIHLSRISKNIQFFFWVFIVSLLLSIGFSIFAY